LRHWQFAVSVHIHDLATKRGAILVALLLCAPASVPVLAADPARG